MARGTVRLLSALISEKHWRSKIMSSRDITLIVFACVFGSALLGVFLGKVLPDRHLSTDAKDIMKLSTGLIATLAALVLGLLVSSAKETYDQANNELLQMAAKIVLLDRVLAQYGPEAKEARALIKSSYSAASEKLLSGDESEQASLTTPEAVARLENIQAKIRELSPQNDAQRGLQSRAIEISGEVASSRWLMVLQREGSISTPLLVVLAFWLAAMFAAWGVFSPRNLVVIVVLLAAALAVSGAIFIILEMDSPLTGWIRVSPVPIEEAVAHLGE
jgi:hypothetical protein